MNKITDYHAKYFAHELTKRCPSDSLEKLASVLIDAQVDLNPHQVDAALFAFKSPLSRGAILADEVGLGKTIEAGLVISQQWAERKRKILIITPSNLRKQWNQELLEKFYLPSTILESKNFNQKVKSEDINPFISSEIVLCSYHFARNKADYIKTVSWDLIIIDEAHRLRNVYKSTNKIAKAIRDAIAEKPILLLTATPLQNSLLELFGLVSFIDAHIFGDVKSFKTQFSKILDQEDFYDLKSRIAPICKRTLRRQVQEYINYKKRICHTQPFIPTEDEQALYDLVSDYLRKPNLQALPNSQRTLLTLVLRKLLASSTYAIAGALLTMSKRLKRKLADATFVESLDDIEKDFEGFNEEQDEWEDVEEVDVITYEQKESIEEEIKDLEDFYKLSVSITNNAKGEALLIALKEGFNKVKELGANERVIIFTESRRTQDYLLNLLSDNGYMDQIVLFNGTNSDAQSKKIYQQWFEKNKSTDKVTGSKSADMRSALVDFFRDEARIMLATEAAAEGINLQFCSLVVNYDMPWNPQRIEQRIGRCHRYGQNFDVVVINFLNQKNAADQRVYELLSEKFQLFDGVFGASDEVLGSIESGVDFEKRIVEIYQKCRTAEEINESFDHLQKEMESVIDETIKKTTNSLFENFDDDVVKKLRIDKRDTDNYYNQYQKWLWDITEYYLCDKAQISKDKYEFILKTNPTNNSEIKLGTYRFEKNVEDAHTYRLGHPLAKHIVNNYKQLKLNEVELEFNLADSGKKISVLEKYQNKSGFLQAKLITIQTLEAEDHIIVSAITDSDEILDEEETIKLFSLPAKQINQSKLEKRNQLQQIHANRLSDLLGVIANRNNTFFDEELDKLDKWAEDMKNSLELELKEIGKEIKLKQTEARRLLDLNQKIEAQKEIKALEKKRNEKRRHLFEAQDNVDARKEELISNVEVRLKQLISEETLFSIRWRLI